LDILSYLLHAVIEYRGIAYQASGQKQEAIQDLEFFLAQGGAQDQVRIEDARARLSELRK
jgi:regulator of sirC expression with transglutaminase-like and TPR domain